MKLIFNDATEIIVQQVESHGDYLRILTVGITPEQLKVLFTDSSRTSRMIVQERGQTIATYKGYTAYDHAEIYTGRSMEWCYTRRGQRPRNVSPMSRILLTRQTQICKWQSRS